MKFLILLILTSVPSFAQTASPVGPIRNKIAAADLLSAESLLDVYKREKGEDAAYLEGLAWLSRGAAILGEWDKAHEYATAARALVDTQLKAGKKLESEAPLLAALGASIEVEAQTILARRGKKPAVAYLQAQLDAFPSPIALRSRLYKRMNSTALEGQRPPEVKGLDLPKSRPVMLFLWASWCGDCKAQAPAVARIKAKYASSDLIIIAPTRLYDAKQAAVEKVWSETYKDLNGIATPISDAIMERYGVSSTPTFVFIDRNGKVRRYLPSRLTDEELSKNIDRILAR